MGFLSRYSGVDVVDFGDGYTVTIKQFLAGDAQEKAETAKVKAVAVASRGKEEKEVRVETSQDIAAYTDILLSEAIVDWNLTDEYDRVLPLAPAAAKTASILLLPADVRGKLRDRIEENTAAQTRTEEEQKIFRPDGHIINSLGEDATVHTE